MRRGFFVPVLLVLSVYLACCGPPVESGCQDRPAEGFMTPKSEASEVRSRVMEGFRHLECSQTWTKTVWNRSKQIMAFFLPWPLELAVLFRASRNLLGYGWHQWQLESFAFRWWISRIDWCINEAETFLASQEQNYQCLHIHIMKVCVEDLLIQTC